MQSFPVRQRTHLGLVAKLLGAGAFAISAATYPESANAPALDAASDCGHVRADAGASRNIYSGPGGGPGVNLICGAGRPTADRAPLLWYEKHTRADRAGKEAFDNGAAYFQLQKSGGNANAVALTSSAIASGGSGDTIALHSRVTGQHPQSRNYAGWFYAQADQPYRVLSGIEINLRNNGADSQWVSNNAPVGTSIGITVMMADKSKYAGSYGYYLGNQEGSRGWKTGYFSRPNAIEPMDADGHGEIMRLEGATREANTYKMLTASGHLVSGLEVTDAKFQRGAIELAANHYIAWGGDRKNSGDKRLAVDSADMLSFSGAGVRLRPINAAPAAAEEGTIVFADGKTWNPGEGRGFYGFDGERWKKL